MKVTLFRPKLKSGRRGSYYVKWRGRGGKEVRRSLEVSDLATAKKIQAEIQRQLAQEKYGLVEENLDYTPEDAWTEYLKLVVDKPARLLAREKSYWDQFFRDVKAPTMRSVRRGDVSAWQKHLLTVRKNRPVSVNTKARQVAAVWSRLIREQVYDGPNPFVGRQRLDTGPPAVRFIPWETVEALLEEARKRDVDLYLAVVLGGLMGLRKAEILAARWEDLDWGREEFRVRGTKTAGSTDTLPLHEAIRERLEPHRQAEGYIVRPGKAPGQWAYRWEFRKPWARLCEDLGIGEARIHDLRHSFATRLLDLGYPMATIARMMRHTSTRMTEKYADLRAVKVRIGRIDGAAAGRAPE